MNGSIEKQYYMDFKLLHPSVYDIHAKLMLNFHITHYAIMNQKLWKGRQGCSIFFFVWKLRASFSTIRLDRGI